MRRRALAGSCAVRSCRAPGRTRCRSAARWTVLGSPGCWASSMGGAEQHRADTVGVQQLAARCGSSRRSWSPRGRRRRPLGEGPQLRARRRCRRLRGVRGTSSRTPTRCAGIEKAARRSWCRARGRDARATDPSGPTGAPTCARRARPAAGVGVRARRGVPGHSPRTAPGRGRRGPPAPRLPRQRRCRFRFGGRVSARHRLPLVACCRRSYLCGGGGPPVASRRLGALCLQRLSPGSLARMASIWRSSCIRRDITCSGW